jgi:hypothetical protein
MRFTREFYVPKGAVKIADKNSDAIVYIYADRAGRPCARGFSGKRNKPDWSFYFNTDKARAQRIEQFFAGRRSIAGRKAADKAERAAFQHDFKVGDILNTCWGYEQTNREFFEVVAVKSKSVVVREIAQVTEATGWERGICVPQPGQYVGEPLLRRAGRYGVRIDNVRRASRSDTMNVGGVKVVKPLGYTSYH